MVNETDAVGFSIAANQAPGLSALGARPKSVALVNTAFGITLATLFLTYLGVAQAELGSISLTSLLAGVTATFLVVVNPIDFALKYLLSWRLSKHPPWSLPQLLPLLGYSDVPKGLKRTASQVYSQSFFGYERGTLITSVYLIIIFVWLELGLTVVPTPDTKNISAVFDVVILGGMVAILVKFIQLVRHAPAKLGIIAAYSWVLRRPSLFRFEDVESFRRALVDGNWLEASDWYTRIELSTQKPAVQAQPPAVQEARTPILSASLKLAGAAIGSVALLAEVTNTGPVGASQVVVLADYDPPIGREVVERFGALGAASSRVIVLDAYLPMQELKKTQNINLRIQSKDERGDAQPEFSSRFSVGDLINELNQETLRKGLNL